MRTKLLIKLRDQKIIFLKLSILIIALTFLIGLSINLETGFIAGADWNLPVTKSQSLQFLETQLSTWNDGWYLGFRNSNHVGIWYALLFNSLQNVSGSPRAINYFVLVLPLLALFTTTVILFKILKIKPVPAIFAGLFLTTAPIIFNYLCMGWSYVVIGYALLNVCLISIQLGSVKGSLRYIAFAGITFGFSLIQSQMIIFFPLIIGSYVFLAYRQVAISKKIGIVFTVLMIGILLNMSTVIQSAIAKDTWLYDNKILDSGVSIGTSIYTTPVNTIRFLGTGFNSQYEYSQKQSGVLFVFTSFIPVLLIILAIVAGKKQNKDTNALLIWSVLLITLGFLLTYLNHSRDVLAYIPFSGMFRDLARFSFVTTYGAVIGIAVGLNKITALEKKRKSIIYSFAALCLLVQFFPWLSGEFTNRHVTNPPQDIRIRTYNYPQGYSVVESILEQADNSQRALYLPIGGLLSINDDVAFIGDYKELRDVYAQYSPIPGVLGVSDRGYGQITPFIQELVQSLKNDDLDDFEKYLKITSTDYLVLRLNTVFENKNTIVKHTEKLEKQSKLTKLYADKDILLYKNQHEYPYLFISTGQENHDLTPEKQLIVKYKKNESIRRNEVRVALTEVKDVFRLVFNESFNQYWKMTDETHQHLRFETHFIANGYANGWLIDTQEICEETNYCVKNPDGTYNMELVIEFWPQRLFYFGAGISISTILLCTIYIIYSTVKERKTRKNDTNNTS